MTTFMHIIGKPKTMKNHHLFNFLKEIVFFNNRAFLVKYPDGYTSVDILFEGSKNLPRKDKKYLRKLLLKIDD